MKRILIIIVFCIGIMMSCIETELELSEVISINDIFTLKENKIVNGQSIHFNLPSNGTYTLSLIDKESLQVISREKFIGQKGENVKKIYTNSIESQYLYLLLEDVTKNQIGKTTIIIK